MIGKDTKKRQRRAKPDAAAALAAADEQLAAAQERVQTTQPEAAVLDERARTLEAAINTELHAAGRAGRDPSTSNPDGWKWRGSNGKRKTRVRSSPVRGR